MTSDTKEGAMVQIAYGDPWTILDSVYKGGQVIEKVQPEIINIYSCAGRKFFWNENGCSEETKPFESLAPTSGFYTSGEFVRENNFVFQHNVTLVIAAMSENMNHSEYKKFRIGDGYSEGQLSLVNRLANFIEAATEELSEANRKLAQQSITDGLTQLYNRREIQKRIDETFYKYKSGGIDSAPLLVMLDIDDFKKVNDTYGHAEGDNVLSRLSALLKAKTHEFSPDSSVGRWGGEEFMILVVDSDIPAVEAFAEDIRRSFSEITFDKCGNKTISIGIVEADKNETSDSFANRADIGMYQSKATGKNKVTVNRDTQN
jgi:diguanylate cyclase (GGDEF)-like protein